MQQRERPGGAINKTRTRKVKRGRERVRRRRKNKAKNTRCVGENYSLKTVGVEYRMKRSARKQGIKGRTHNFELLYMKQLRETSVNFCSKKVTCMLNMAGVMNHFVQRGGTMPLKIDTHTHKKNSANKSNGKTRIENNSHWANPSSHRKSVVLWGSSNNAKQTM